MPLLFQSLKTKSLEKNQTFTIGDKTVCRNYGQKFAVLPTGVTSY